MPIRQLKNGKWFVDVRPEHAAVSKRVRKTVDTKIEARAIEREILNKADIGQSIAKKNDNRNLKQLIDWWFSAHGHTLRDGEARLKKLYFSCRGMRNPLLRNLTPTLWTNYRRVRLAGEIVVPVQTGSERLQQGRKIKVSENTVNHEHAYLKAVFGKAIEMREWRGENPFASVRLIPLDDSTARYLTNDEIKLLLAAVDESRNEFVGCITRLCLSTGARWGEAESMTRGQVDFETNRVTYTKTKNFGSRQLPISAALAARLKPFCDGKAINEPIFGGSYAAFQAAVEKAAIVLPPGQLSHVLRHSFASHYMINGGDFLRLNKALGHKTIQMTQRYSHLAPDHLRDVAGKNPLDSINLHSEME
jgi:integrase